MAYQCFDVSIADGIAHIVMNRPEVRNNMNPAFWEELPQIVREIDADAQARVIVISSTARVLCGGVYLSRLGSGAADDVSTTPHGKGQRGLNFLETVKRMQDGLSVLEQWRLPVLVAIQGGCIGGGVDLATAADMRYATADAFVTIYETKIGMTADVGTFPRIVKLIPEGIVRELAYTGRRMPAAEALNVGLVNRLFDDHEAMLDGVMDVAREIAANAPLAVHGCKRAISYARDHSTQDGLDWIGLWNASNLHPEEIQEAMQARAEKRPADFADLPKRRA